MASSTPTGRPRKLVDREQINRLRYLRFTWDEIAALLGTSASTIKRRAKQWGIESYSSISDVELDTAVRQFLLQFPKSGEVMLRGHLQSASILVQRSRMRLSVVRVAGRQFRSTPIERRIYSVSGPNALWHLDGNHKLIHWKLVVHGAIDGFSQMITFLQCSNNNRSETVLDYFQGSIDEFGIPSRIRTDHGGENVLVWDFMEQYRGSGRGSFIAGRSVHNSRIERLWRDVRTAVLSSYREVFLELQSDGALNVDNDADIFSLHYVFIPRINQSLSAFKSAWNNHPVSTESSMSPMQLYMAYSQGSHLFDEHIDPSFYGVDPTLHSPSNEDDNDSVAVPEVPIPLSEASIQQLQSINPLEECNDFGKQLYLDTVRLIFNLMLNDDLID